jgi:hypothetical protein
MRRAVSGYAISLRAIGLVMALALLAACGPAATPTPTVPMPEPGPEWDYVVLGDSVTFGFPNYYAAHIEADLGVKVTVHYWSRDGLRSTKLLEMLRNDEDLRSDISEAEVVTFHIPAGAIGDAQRSYRAGTCGGTDNQDCLREAVRLLKADIDAIITEILSLTSTSDTIIRAMEFYNPGVSEWKGLGIFEEINPYHAAHNEYLV